MNKLFKITLILGLGLIITSFIIGLEFNDIKNYFNDDHNYESKSLIIENETTNISIELIDRNINVLTTTNNSYIEYFVHKEKDVLSNNYEDNQFNFKLEKKKTLTNFLNTKYTSSKVRKVNLYINEEVKELTIKNVYGEILFDNSELNNLKITSTTGAVKLKDLKIKESLNISLTTGKIHLTNIDALLIDVVNTTGNIVLNNLNATYIKAKTTTGNINITDQRDNIGYLANVTTGNITLKGERVLALSDERNDYLIFYELKTTTGNINIK